MSKFLAAIRSFIASALVVVGFLLPYYPEKMDVKVDAIAAGATEVVLTFENNTNRNVKVKPDGFKMEAYVNGQLVAVDTAAATGFSSLKSSMEDTMTVTFGTALAPGSYSLTFTFETTNGWLTKGRTFETVYEFTVA